MLAAMSGLTIALMAIHGTSFLVAIIIANEARRVARKHGALLRSIATESRTENAKGSGIGMLMAIYLFIAFLVACITFLFAPW